MQPVTDTSSRSEPDDIRVHYWASARAESGVDAEDVAVTGPITLAGLIDVLVERHPGTRLRDVLFACSVLRGEEPVKSQDPGTVEVRPGQTIEFLPPFAGG